ncbi:MAG: sensor histidine kinase [Crocinitomicaceae bacterium]|nr:sensor histidine kinase [Crocinitomicaceae bacterium]
MKKSIVILLHAGYWACVLIILSLLSGASTINFVGITDDGPSYGYVFRLFVGTALIPALTAFYLYYFFLFPEYIKKKKLGRTIGLGFLFSVLGAIEGSLYLTIGIKADLMTRMGPGIFIEIFSSIIIIAALSGIMGFIMKGFLTWFKDMKVKEELAEKNHQMEMALVKAQLDPHFLFNTINNIDVLIQKKPEAASEYLNKLSEILRFMLFETKAEQISLNMEVDYISKFIELHRIRSSNSKFVNFKGCESNLTVAPMLFMPFIENAFKHCSDKKSDNSIQIEIKTKGSEIFFSCKNKYDVNKKSIGTDHGLGMELINKRLLTLYPNSHNLNVSKSKAQYEVSLSLRTNEH